MFCGAGGPEIAKSDRVGGKSAAVIYGLTGTAKLHGTDPELAANPFFPASKNYNYGALRVFLPRSSQHTKWLRKFAKMQFGLAAVPLELERCFHAMPNPASLGSPDRLSEPPYQNPPGTAKSVMTQKLAEISQ